MSYRQWKHISGKLAVQYKNEDAVIYDAMGFCINTGSFEELGDDDWIELTPDISKINFKELYKLIAARLSVSVNDNGNFTDLGNEIGTVIASYYKNIDDNDINNLIFAFKKGIINARKQ